MKNQLPVVFLTFANDKVDDALYLRNLPKELHSIRTALSKAEKAGLCEIVERTAATVYDIFDTFQDERYKDRIAIFHYGGHASGNQLMLETLSGEQETAHSDGLIPFLGKQKGLKLAFFNGCSSQKQAMELSEAGVSAVIGTATAIKDEVATELASRFYNGIASGSTLYQSWLEAVDVLKTKNSTKKQKGLKLRRDKNSNEFPWDLYIREGAEIVKEWNLPNAAQNPLFGLPDLPKANLPEEPFRFLRRYEPQHAELFFGRGQYVRQLYKRITSDKAAPVILFYGQSGAGKSSTLDAGLLPRLQQEGDVKYLRRDINIGLLGTLDAALGGDFKSAVLDNKDGTVTLISDIESQIEQMKVIKTSVGEEQAPAAESIIDTLQKRLEEQNVNIDTENAITRLDRWLKIEAETNRPFNILLDQVEETFTRYNPDIENELEQLLLEIQQIFEDPNMRPKGKIILSYRKEYHPEIEEFCKKLQIPREGIFLKKLEKSDIEQVVKGIASTDQLRQKYHISIEEELPSIIADDLLEDKDSPIAPVLSILLTKIWDLSQQEQVSIFTIEQYQRLKKEGILMEDFFHQQMEKLHAWKPEIEESGLALDVLNFHTTALGTAGSQSVETLRERYEHKANEIDELLNQFKDLYLLTDAGKLQTGLAHDTLAPIIIKEMRESDKAGQRALRVLTGKANEFKDNKKHLLGNIDLQIVEDGQTGMRLWNDLEQELIEVSQARRAKQRAVRRNWIMVGAMAVLVIVGLGFWAIRQQKIAQREAQTAKIKAHIGDALIAYNRANFKNSFHSAKQAYDLKRDNVAIEYLIKPYYGVIYELDGQYYTNPFHTLKGFDDLENIRFAKNNIIVGLKKVSSSSSTTTIVIRNLDGTTIQEYEEPNFNKEESVISNTGRYFIYKKGEQTVWLDLDNEAKSILNIPYKKYSNYPEISPNGKYYLNKKTSSVEVFNIEKNKLVKTIQLNDIHKSSYEIGFVDDKIIYQKGHYSNEDNTFNQVETYLLDEGQLIQGRIFEGKDIVASDTTYKNPINISPSGKFFVFSIERTLDSNPLYTIEKRVVWTKEKNRIIPLSKKNITKNNRNQAISYGGEKIPLSKEDYDFFVQITKYDIGKAFSKKDKLNIEEYTEKNEERDGITIIQNELGNVILELNGDPIIHSENKQLILTTEGIYDLKENFYPAVKQIHRGGDVFVKMILDYFTEDGKYLIKLDHKDNLSSVFNIDEKIYVENISNKQEKAFKNARVKTLSINKKVSLGDLKAKPSEGKVIVYKNDLQLVELETLGESLLNIRFRANGDAIEVVSFNETGFFEIEMYTQLFWINPEKIIKMHRQQE